MYQRKYRKYTEKLNQLIGGGAPIKIGDNDSLLQFIRERIENRTTTVKKYCVILFGPPASGKTLAKKIATAYINKYYDQQTTYEEIAKSFIDCNLDDIVYDIKIDTKTVKDTLLQITNDTLFGNPSQAIAQSGDAVAAADMLSKISFTSKSPGSTSQSPIFASAVPPSFPSAVNISDAEKIVLAKQHIDTLVGKTGDVYFKNRSNGDKLSELLRYVAAFLGHNLYIEIATPQEDYLKNIIFTFCDWYQYIPIIIYPFTNNPDILCERMYKRGISEGRFLKCENVPYGIKRIMINDLNFYPILKEIIPKNTNNMVLMYNTDINESIRSELESYNISNFDTYVLELINNNQLIKSIPNFIDITRIT